MEVLRRLFTWINGIIKQANYRRGFHARTHRVCGSSFRSYDPVIPEEPLMEELVARFEAGDVMYDVGAHAGRYSLLAASIGARVVSFEPNPHAYSRLTANISANGYSSIASLNIGLGEESGKQVFYISSQEPRSSFKRENAEYGSSEIVGEIEVPIEPLDEFADEYSAPDHLKVDVEGFGLRVLRGGERMIAEQRPIIFFEAHGNADEAYDWCEEMGYTVNEIGYPWVCIPNEKE